jgi:hypothetical protein
MKVIGRDHRTRELVGWHLITTESGSLWVTGTGSAAGVNTTTTGTATGTGISVSMNTDGATAGTMVGTTVASSARSVAPAKNAEVVAM